MHYIHTYIHYIHTCTHTDAPYIHTYMHTHIYIYTYINIQYIYIYIMRYYEPFPTWKNANIPYNTYNNRSNLNKQTNIYLLHLLHLHQHLRLISACRPIRAIKWSCQNAKLFPRPQPIIESAADILITSKSYDFGRQALHCDQIWININKYMYIYL